MRFLLTFLLVITLAGCNTIPDAPSPPDAKPYVFIKPDRQPALNLQSPDWQVRNQQEIAELSKDPRQVDEVWYMLTQDQFKSLMNNIIRMSDKLLKQDKALDYYEKSVDEYDKAVNASP